MHTYFQCFCSFQFLGFTGIHRQTERTNKETEEGIKDLCKATEEHRR